LVEAVVTDYQPLSDFLAASRAAEVSLHLGDVERVLGQPLPASAYRHQAWWANTATHGHARAWMGVGWRTARLNLPKRVVTFIRNRSASPHAPATTPAAGSEAIMVEKESLSPVAITLLERHAAEAGTDLAAAAASLLNEAALDRRRRLLARFEEMSPVVAGDSTDLIREDRDAR
jgi:hypothetical protein